MKHFRKNWVPALAGVTLLLGLTGCDSIGDGGTVESIEIFPSTFATARPHAMYQCLRDQAVAVATFTDGTRADFSERVRWTTDNASIVSVSNGDVPFVAPYGVGFYNVANTYYRAGTLTPGATGEAHVTATFASLSATMKVTVATPAFKAAAVADGVDVEAVQGRSFVAPNLYGRFRMFIVLPDGRKTFPSDLNPVVWRFTSGETSSDGLTHYAPTAASPKIRVVTSVNQAVVTGVEAGADTYNVEALTYLCQNDPTYRPNVQVQVATATGFDVAHEKNFNGPGVNNDYGNLFGGSDEYLRVIATLNDGTATPRYLDVSTQVDFNVAHPTCNDGDANCVCTDTNADGTCACADDDCRKLVLFNASNRFYSLVTDDTEDAVVKACFTDIDSDHSDDCEEVAAAEDTSIASDTVTIRVVPVDFTTGTFTVNPLSGSETVFSYPGFKFDAYATHTAVAGFTFLDATPADPTDDPTSGQQNVTRYVAWEAFEAGSTSTYTSVAYVRAFGDDFLATFGNVEYVADVTAPTTIDIYATPYAPFAALGRSTTPAQLTINP